MFKANLKAWKEEFILNNKDKFERAAREAGDNASPEEFLGIYDRLAGLILDKKGNKIENGIFGERFKKWKDEQPKYIKTLEDRSKFIDEGEKRLTELILVNIDHKRSFLGILMTIAAAVIAGLFILMINENSDYLNLFSTISSLGFSIFIISSGIYLTFILSQESQTLDSGYKFIKNSKKNFLEKIGTEIVDLDSYEKYRIQKYEEEKDSKIESKLISEKWFIGVSLFFIGSAISTLIMLIYALCKNYF
jgi:hypothetical protein